MKKPNDAKFKKPKKRKMTNGETEFDGKMIKTEDGEPKIIPSRT